MLDLTAGGATFQGGKWRRLVREGIPAVPDEFDLPPARKPGTPLLDPRAPEAVNADLLVRAYRAAVLAVFGECNEAHVLKRSAVVKYRGYKKLTTCVKLLLEIQERSENPAPISPVVWATWKARHWEKINRKGVIPLAQLWAPGTLSKPGNRGWCRKDMGGGVREGSGSLYTPQSQELLAAHAACKRDLLALESNDIRDFWDIWDEHFPNGSWESSLAFASTSQRVLSDKIRGQVENLDPSLWGL